MHYPLIVPNYLTSSGGEILPTAAAEPFSMEMKRQKLRQNISNSSADPFDMDQQAIMDSTKLERLMGISNFLARRPFSPI